MTQIPNNYNLEERTAKFGEAIIQFCKLIPENSITRPLINQLIRSGTSIGANYMEANGGGSPRDFKNKIFICKEKAQETKNWLRMMVQCDGVNKEISRTLWKEAQELTLIFQSIINSMNKKGKNISYCKLNEK